MNIICAPSGIVDIDRPKQGIGDMVRAGFENILLDLTLYCPATELENVGKSSGKAGQKSKVAIPEQLFAMQNCNEKRLQIGEAELPQNPEEKLLSGSKEKSLQGYADKVLQNYAEKLLQSSQETHLAFPAAIAPYLKWGTKRTDLKEFLITLTRESIRICGQAGCKYLIVRPLSAPIAAGDVWEENKAFYLSLADFARENDVILLLENQCRDMNGHFVRGACSEVGEAAFWVDGLNQAAGEERFGFCMNVGNYNLCGQAMGEIAVQLGSRVKAVVLRDGNGQGESAMLPFTAVCNGQPRTDWLSLIRGLRESGFDGELILDLADTAAVFSPILRPQLLTLAKAVAEYFQWQIGIENTLKKYGSIVLFGAGNMCRNYMKCYGEKYPPLFTCDNNRTLWGTVFCGLEVRAPECLADLPEDCAIFICNIYYREIEQQLRQMQIMNPIEFFNDEYMPSFYFDRLQRD